MATGYNGLPRCVADAPQRYEAPQKQYLVTHAEVNAVLNAVVQPASGVLYATAFPCAACAQVIIQAGIDEVVAPPPEVGRVSKWEESWQWARVILAEAGVVVRSVDLCGG